MAKFSVKAEIVSRPEDYNYSSTVDYSGEKGLLDIVFASVSGLKILMLVKGWIANPTNEARCISGRTGREKKVC